MQIKAWCYYESRLLGAHHGLISTYGLETMVLYIFNFFHKELQTPCQVRQQARLLGAGRWLHNTCHDCAPFWNVQHTFA